MIGVKSYCKMKNTVRCYYMWLHVPYVIIATLGVLLTLLYFYFIILQVFMFCLQASFNFLKTLIFSVNSSLNINNCSKSMYIICILMSRLYNLSVLLVRGLHLLLFFLVEILLRILQIFFQYISLKFSVLLLLIYIYF